MKSLTAFAMQKKAAEQMRYTVKTQPVMSGQQSTLVIHSRRSATFAIMLRIATHSLWRTYTSLRWRILSLGMSVAEKADIRVRDDPQSTK